MLGIYIHIPFCKKKCLYCDFASVEEEGIVADYFDALKKEIELTSKINKGVVNTIFIGGGTPSFVQAKYIGETLNLINKSFNLKENAEITIETNPNSLSLTKLKEYRSFGINRLSIGLQTTVEQTLKYIGRQHTLAHFESAYKNARQEGFSNINVDLIYALPYQTIRDFYNTLNYVIEQNPEHISAYSLKLEENTPLYNMYEKEEFKKADENTEVKMYHIAQNMLEDNGFTNYEISNFAKSGYECVHNLKYWNLKDYLGIGVSSASNIGNLRFSHDGDIAKYISNLKASKLIYDSNEILKQNGRKGEYIMLKTRLKRGINLNEYNRIFNSDFLAEFGDEVEKAKNLGLVKVIKNGVIPTKKGFDFQNKLTLILTQTL